MSLNWEILGVVSEFVGAVAVVISLIYLSVQIRQNTRLMRATAKQSLTETTQGLIYHLSENADVWVKLVSGQEPTSAEEDARMSLLVRAMLRGFESQCYQYETGLLEAEEWQALRQAMRDICRLPGCRTYWLQLKPHMSARLRKVVDLE